MALGEIKSVQLANGVTVVAPVGVPLTAARLELAEVSAPATPPSGFLYLYVKTDGILYSKDDAGVERAYEASDADLTAIAALSSTGLIARTGAGTAATRAIMAGTTRIGVTNGNGVSGDPTIDVNEGNLSLPNIGGTLTIAKGGTGAGTAQAAFNALSPQTTKGDLAVHDGTNDVRLGVGADGEVLVARSVEATGLRWEAPSGGSGSGEINCITNPNAATSTTGWVAGGGITITRITSGSPLDPVITTALRISNPGGSSTEDPANGGYSTFTLPDTLENRKLKVQFYCRVPSTNVWRLSVYDGTTRLPLSKDSSNATTLPAGFVGTFTAYFDSTSNNNYSVNFTATSGTGTNLDVTNVIVGPDITAQGAAVDQWVSFTAGSNFTNCTHTGRYRRVGDSMELNVRGSFTGAPAAITQVTINLPTGFTIDNTKLPSASDACVVGVAYGRDSGVADYIGSVYALGGTPGSVTVTSGAGASDGWDEGRPFAWNTSDSWSISCVLPISQWSGSGTVNLAQNDVEFLAYQDNAATAAGTAYSTAANFVRSSNGAQLQNVSNSSTDNDTQFDMTWQSPQQSGDNIMLQISFDSGATFVPMESWYPRTFQNLFRFGARWEAISATTVRVRFGNRGASPEGTAFATGSGVAWNSGASSAIRWRLVKTASGQAVGFGTATATQSGLVSTSEQTWSGIKRLATGLDVRHNGALPGTAASRVASGTFTPANSGSVDVNTITFNSGQWLRVGNVVTFSVTLSAIAATAAPDLRFTLPFNGIGSSTSATGNFVSPDNVVGVAIVSNTGVNGRVTWTATAGVGTLRDYRIHMTYECVA